ncbi:hypothetical protein ES703_62777 [subsurface metagenome]
MLQWIKKHFTVITTILITIGFAFYCYGCEPQTASLVTPHRLINRQELQLELDQLIGLAQIRMIDLDKQEQLRAVILENALILVQGTPVNPVGILTGVAAIYGLMQGSTNVTKIVKTTIKKRKEPNA